MILAALSIRRDYFEDGHFTLSLNAGGNASKDAMPVSHDPACGDALTFA